MKTCGRRVFRWLVPTCLFLALFINVVVAAEKAEDFPSKPITIYIAFSPGGSTDLSTRALADAASKILKQSIVCVNKPGGLGASALSELLSKKADGYTLSTLTYPMVTIVPHMLSLPFSPLDDFTHIMSLGRYLYD